MAIEIGIVDLERTLPGGVVTTIHWTATLTDGDYAASTYGSLGVAGDASDPEFVPFDQLTKEQVVAWVLKNFGDERVENIENNLAAQIQAQKTPTTASGLPW